MTAEKSSGFTHNRGSLGFWIFIVVCAYFGLAQYWLIKTAIWSSKFIADYALYQELIKVPWWIILFYSSELGGTVGIVLRSVAGFFALYSAVLFWRKKESAPSLIRGKVSTALLFEGGYYLTYIPTVVLGFVYPLTEDLWYFDTTPELVVLLVNGVACLMMVMVIPPLLFKLRSKIIQGSSSQDIIKWSCLTGISYLFVVFWFNYSISWVATVIPWTIREQPGMRVLLDPINLASFLATVFGLFLIAIFGLMSTLPAIKKLPVELSLRRIGATMMAFGGYFVLMILLYVLAGGYAEHPTVWFEIIGPHNPDLWCVTFLCIGLPLLASRKIKNPK